MIVTEVRVEYKRTVSLGNYESASATVGLTSTVDEGESAQAVEKELMTMATEMVKDKLLPLVRIHEVDAELVRKAAGEVIK